MACSSLPIYFKILNKFHYSIRLVPIMPSRKLIRNLRRKIKEFLTKFSFIWKIMYLFRRLKWFHHEISRIVLRSAKTLTNPIILIKLLVLSLPTNQHFKWWDTIQDSRKFTFIMQNTFYWKIKELLSYTIDIKYKISHIWPGCPIQDSLCIRNITFWLRQRVVLAAVLVAVLLISLGIHPTSFQWP